MDGVLSVRNLSNFPKFLLYPDPVFTKFNPEVKYYKDELLTINGKNLKLAIGVNNVSVITSLIITEHEKKLQYICKIAVQI
jgi:hypothetical protein